MDICSSMFVRKKNIPPRNRGGLCRSRRDFSGAISVLIHAYLAMIFPGAAHIAAPEMLRYSPARRVSPCRDRKIPAPETGTGSMRDVLK